MAMAPNRQAPSATASTPATSTRLEQTSLSHVSLAQDTSVSRRLVSAVSPDPRDGASAGPVRQPPSSDGNSGVHAFSATAQTGIAWPGSAPFLYFIPPASGLPNHSNVITLGPGSLWISARQFDAATPASGFVGLKLVNGMIRYSTTMVLAPNPITLTNGVGPLIVSLKLASTSSSYGATPVDVVFRFDANQTGVLANSGQGTLNVYGNAYSLSYPSSPTPSFYDPLFGRIQFTLQYDNHSLSIPQVEGLAQFQTDSSGVHVTAASLSWPVTVTTGLGFLADSAENAAISLELGYGLNGNFIGAAMDLGSLCQLVCDPMTFLAVGGVGARFLGLSPQVLLGTSGSTLNILPPASGKLAFRYVDNFNGGLEIWAVLATPAAVLDQPRTINNDRVFHRALAPCFLYKDSTNTNSLSLEVESENAISPETSPLSFAMKNLLVKTSSPTSLTIKGTLSSLSSPAIMILGEFTLNLGLTFVLPFLPDPYTTNFSFAVDAPTEKDPPPVIVTVTWTQSSTTVDVNLPQDAFDTSSILSQTINDGDPDLTNNDAAKLSELDRIFATGTGIQTFDSNQLLGSGPTLLDLSTNVSRFGVSFPFPTIGNADRPAVPVSINNLYLALPASMIGVMTLPAVQWEAIVTDPSDDSVTKAGYPSPLQYLNSGPTSVFRQTSVALTPVAPRPAIDGLIAAYQSRAADLAVRFTLPQGLVATVLLQHKKNVLFGAASLNQIQPVFTSASTTSLTFTGGDQLSIEPPFSPFIGFRSSQSPQFQSATYQLHNGLDQTGALTVSSLGDDVDQIFNNQFGPKSSSSGGGVPVLRADISGFGESVFSQWRDPSLLSGTGVPAPGVSQVHLDVATGRTVTEVVQVVSDMVPFAVRTVCTVTISRLNSGVLFRKTDWKALSPGIYHYMNSNIVSHPGVVVGISDVTNIHDTGERFTSTTSYVFAGLTYDATVSLENCVVGQVGNGIPCKSMLGFVQIGSPVANTAFTPAEYQELLTYVGPRISTSIDCAIDIGLSGQRMTISHISVATAFNTSGNPEFCMVASGSPRLISGVAAQWSFISQAAGDPAPGAVDGTAGVPLIRMGPISSATPALPNPTPVPPYRFASPEDLFNTGSSLAKTEYSLMHCTGTQRVAFRRPKIEADGLNRITSVISPLLADLYALGTSMGPFPAAQTCLVLDPPAGDSYWLQIIGGGNLVLHLAQIAVPAGANSSSRVLVSSPNFTATVYASRSGLPPTTITLTIDTTAVLPWSISVTSLSLASSVAQAGELYSVYGDIQGDANTPAHLANSQLLFGPGLATVQSVIHFLEMLGPIPPIQVAMTNEFRVLGSLACDLSSYLESILQPEVKEAIQQFVQELSFGVEIDLKLPVTSVTLIADLVFSIFIDPYAIILIFKFSALFGSDGGALEITAGGGLGIGFKIGGIFDAVGYAALCLDLFENQGNWDVGATQILHAEVKFSEVLKASVEIEGTEALIHQNCASGSTIWSFIQATVQIEIQVFAILNIDISVQFEQDTAHQYPAACKLIHA